MAHETPEPMPWDRLGAALGDIATVGRNMADRNLRLWSTISQDLREKPYTADKLTNDLALGLEAAMSNVQDAWESLMRPPERERVADTLPSAFLVFPPARRDGNRVMWDHVDPVWLRVTGARSTTLPKTAQVELGGGDRAGAAALRGCLSATLGPSGQAYLLEVTSPRNLRPGVYSGSVYINNPNARPIANLRVIVEGDPVTGAAGVPVVLLRYGVRPPRRVEKPVLGASAEPDPSKPTRRTWQPAEPVSIPAPIESDDLAEEALVKLSGADHDATEDLADSIIATLDPLTRAYVVTINPKHEAPKPGLYSGSLYITEPYATPVAELRIVVEEVPSAAGGGGATPAGDGDV
jgi:hypothetical protein